jgi:hypothetical protein
MLGQLPADEDPALVIAENGQPPMFDFFGLGQPSQQHHNFQLALENTEQDHQPRWGQWAQEAEQEDANMNVDLNLQQPLNGDIPNEVNHNMGKQVIPSLNFAPESMVINSYEPQASDAISSSTDDSINQLMETCEEQALVLVLQAPQSILCISKFLLKI